MVPVLYKRNCLLRSHFGLSIPDNYAGFSRASGAAALNPDINGDGLYDPFASPPETPILEQATLLRWRDGTVYQGNVTDPEGLYAFDQVFPFFSWLVAEVDFARFEATSLTVVVDNGGPVPFGATAPGIGPEDDLTFGGMVAPQPDSRTCADAHLCTPVRAPG